MKIIVLLVTVLALTIHVSCETDEEVRKIKEKCFDLSDIPVEDRVVYNPENPKLKCFNACTATGLGMMKNGKILPEKYIERLLESFKDSKLKKSEIDELTKHLKDCAEQANKQTDECEVAFSMIKCF